MEDWEVKKAYQLVYENLWDICHTRSVCTDCPVREACDQSDEFLHVLVKATMENLFGKEEVKNDI